jgi:putative acetyltransferase
MCCTLILQWQLTIIRNGEMMPKVMKVRAETIDDTEAVRTVNLAAFGQADEADLVERLRLVASTIAFVAVEDPSGKIVGHIAYSTVEVVGDCAEGLCLMGLAPLSVLPAYQRQGVGSQLVRHSLKVLSDMGCKAVFVLGSPDYYGRFGFVTAASRGFRCEFAVPDEYFMVLGLAQGALEGCSGLVKYRPEFDVFK